jgi:hypothetical protein
MVLYYFERSIYDLAIEFGMTIRDVTSDLIDLQREPLSSKTFYDVQKIVLSQPDRKLHVGAFLVLVALAYLFVFISS